MRLTVNLSLFFHDHRSLVKIFVHEDMKIISDVEDHVTKIFNINNFYFKCENQYLPSCESVHVLKTDDIIWAVPFDNTINDGLINGNEDSGISEVKLDTLTKEKKKKKEKKRKINHPEAVDIPEENISEKYESHITKRKKKRRSLTCKDEVMDEMEVKPNDTFVEVAVAENTKISPYAQNLTNNMEMNIETHKSPKRSSPNAHNSTYNMEMKECSLSSIENNETVGSSVKSLVNTFEKKVNSFYNAIDEDRKINIVKTIIVSKSEDPSENKVEAEVSNDAPTQNTLFSNSFKNGRFSESESVDSSIYFSNSNEPDADVNKRKRKRVRTRKPKPFYVDEVQTFEQPTYSYFVNRPSVQNPSHIRFEDVSVQENGVDTKLEKSQEKEEKFQKSDGSEVTINDSVATTSQVEINLEKEKNGIKEEKNKFDVAFTKELETCILKQPITSVVTPKVDDIIAFKILRISENYTPEFSSTIVGKVLCYDSATNQVKFHIKYGREQCVMPQGKFSLELEKDDEQQQNEGSQEFQFVWTNLLEPRLLFP